VPPYLQDAGWKFNELVTQPLLITVITINDAAWDKVRMMEEL
jgi:hypothetical protein